MDGRFCVLREKERDCNPPICALKSAVGINTYRFLFRFFVTKKSRALRNLGYWIFSCEVSSAHLLCEAYDILTSTSTDAGI